jgi:hypothetical protein
MLIKLYGEPPSSPEAARRYSPSECVGTRTENITCNPDPKHVSISSAERANLTMWMAVRRFTRLTNAFSKKLENHAHMVALYALWYNFVRIHKTPRISPAMAVGNRDAAMVDGGCGSNDRTARGFSVKRALGRIAVDSCRRRYCNFL